MQRLICGPNIPLLLYLSGNEDFVVLKMHASLLFYSSPPTMRDSYMP